MKSLVSVDVIEQSILLIRGHKVILDSILAQLYEVQTKNLNKAYKQQFRSISG